MNSQCPMQLSNKCAQISHQLEWQAISKVSLFKYVEENKIKISRTTSMFKKTFFLKASSIKFVSVSCKIKGAFCSLGRTGFSGPCGFTNHLQRTSKYGKAEMFVPILYSVAWNANRISTMPNGDTFAEGMKRSSWISFANSQISACGCASANIAPTISDS